MPHEILENLRPPLSRDDLIAHGAKFRMFERGEKVLGCGKKLTITQRLEGSEFELSDTEKKLSLELCGEEAKPIVSVRGTSGDLRHPRRSRYRCSLPGLAGFAGPRCTEPEAPRSGSRSSRLPGFSLTQRSSSLAKVERNNFRFD